MAAKYPEPSNLFTGVDYAATLPESHLPEAGSYSPPSVLSPHQFTDSSAGFRFRQQIGSIRLMHSKSGTKFSVGGGGFRFSGAGRLSHVNTSEG